jgi:dynein heavy chain 1
LDKYLERVENVLGERWTDHVEGKKCKEIGDNFKKALNYIPKIENWNKSIMEFTRNMNQNERIFEIVQKKKLEIIVNFDKRMIDLFKEIRFLA